MSAVRDLSDDRSDISSADQSESVNLMQDLMLFYCCATVGAGLTAGIGALSGVLGAIFFSKLGFKGHNAGDMAKIGALGDAIVGEVVAVAMVSVLALKYCGLFKQKTYASITGCGLLAMPFGLIAGMLAGFALLKRALNTPMTPLQVLADSAVGLGIVLIPICLIFACCAGIAGALALKSKLNNKNDEPGISMSLLKKKNRGQA
jgi:hypothetical protein